MAKDFVIDVRTHSSDGCFVMIVFVHGNYYLCVCVPFFHCNGANGSMERHLLLKLSFPRRREQMEQENEKESERKQTRVKWKKWLAHMIYAFILSL